MGPFGRGGTHAAPAGGFSSSWLAWRFYAGGSWGFGFASADTLGQMRILGYSSWGAAFNFSVGQAARLADFPEYLQGESFVLLNLLAIPFLALLLLQLGLKLVAADSSPVPEPNHALQRTPSA